ncbi:hypothetical protein L195_g043987, partial [Trifolium pratense]
MSYRESNTTLPHHFQTPNWGRESSGFLNRCRWWSFSPPPPDVIHDLCLGVNKSGDGFLKNKEVMHNLGYQDLRFVSGIIIICISLVSGFKLLGLKESDIACYRLLQGVDDTWKLFTSFYS